jgi:hypothetical protein
VSTNVSKRAQIAPHIGAGGRLSTVLTHETNGILDPAKVAHRAAQWGILETNAQMATARDRLTDQRPDIGAKACDHP